MTHYEFHYRYQPEDRVGVLARVYLFPLALLVVAAAALSLINPVVDGAAVVLLGLTTLLAVVVFERVARRDPEHTVLFTVLILAWLAKLASVVFKLYLISTVYGRGDALGYHRAGIEVSQLLASGQLPDLTRFWGTPFVENAAGLMYLVTTPTLLGGWLVWSLLGTLGMLFQYKGFVVGVPHGHRRWFMALVFFAPSVLVWTNTLGKDALVAFCLGMTAWGVALFATRGLTFSALVWLGLGVVGTGLVRPHIAAIAAVGLVAAAFVRPIRAGMLSPVLRVAMAGAVVALAVVVIRTSASFIGLEDVTYGGVTDFFGYQAGQTAQGGSAFESAGFPTNPGAFALAVITVLFRPFPWEANNLLAMASALEAMVLVGLVLYRFRSVVAAIKSVVRNPYVAFTVVYAVMFVFFFSAISNFGILARQRVQLLPLVFVWIAFLGQGGRREPPDVR